MSIYSLLKKARGFTLIELLIVIAIIAILTVAFLPTLRGGQAGARNSARKAAANDIVIAIERIVNGDIPAGVTLGAATAGAIPLSTGECLNFGSGLGADIRAVLGRTPTSYFENTVVCDSSVSGSGFWYKSFPSTGTANNYMVVAQVELPVSNGNVSGASILLTSDPTAFNSGVFNSWTDVLGRTTGVSTNALWVVTK